MKMKYLLFMQDLLLVVSLIGCWKANGEATVTDEHLLAIGSAGRGNSMLTITSKLRAALNTVFSLDGQSLSSACGTHPSRCREVMVESETITNLTSKHTIFIPLENGLHLLQLLHNGNSNELSLHSQYTLTFSGINGVRNCSSLSPQRIGSVHYLPCVSTENLYICSLNINLTAIEQSSVQRCAPMPFNIRMNEYTSLSNIILSNDASISQQHLLFLFQNFLCRLYPVTNSLSVAYDFSSECSSASQLLLPSPKLESELLIYCRDRRSIVYNTNIDQIVSHAQLDNVLYPCSQSAEFIVHLTQTTMDFSYKVSRDGSDVVKIFVSQTASSDFYSGICFDFGNHQIFAFLDRSNGIFMFNTASENFTLLHRTQGCGVEDCELLLKYNNRYLVIRNRELRKVTVYDVIDGRVIITSDNDNFQLVGLIYNIQTVRVPTTESPTMSTTTISTSESPTDSNNQAPPSLGGGIIAAVVVIVIVIIGLSFAITIIIIYLVFRRRKPNIQRSPSDDVDAQVHGNIHLSPSEEETLDEQLHEDEPIGEPPDNQDSQEPQEVPLTSMNNSTPSTDEEVTNVCSEEGNNEPTTEAAETPSANEATDNADDTVDIGETDETNEAVKTTTESKNPADKEDSLGDHQGHTDQSDSHNDTGEQSEAASLQPTESEGQSDGIQLTSVQKGTKIHQSTDLSNSKGSKLEKTDSLLPFRVHFMKEENDSCTSDSPSNDTQTSNLTYL